MTWPLVKIKDIFDVARGGSPRPIDAFITDAENGVNWIMIGDTKEGGKYIEKTAKKIKPEGVKNSREVKEGDFLLTNSMSFGRPYILKTSGCIHDGWLVLSPRTEEIHKDYFYYYLGSQEIKSTLASKAAGAVVKNLNKDIVKELEIPLPPFEEQKRIAAILDKADAIRQKRQQAITLADDFLRSVFLDMFGDPVTNPKEWDIYPLKKGITNITAGWSANGENHSCGDDEIGVLKISAVTSGIFKPDENKVVSSSTIPSNKKLVFPRKGDLLFSRANTRELVGATCIVDSDYDNVFLPDKLWVINLNSNELFPEYVHMLIQHPKFKESLTSQATGSSGSMLNISKAKFEETLAPYPSLDVQKRFKDIFWKVMACNALTNDSKTNFVNQFNALSQKAFSGQL